MKNLIVGALLLLSTATFAQTEVVKGDNTPASQTTRLRLGANTSTMGQTTQAGSFSAFALESQALPRTITVADTTMPTQPGIRLGMHPTTGRFGVKKYNSGNWQQLVVASELNAAWSVINTNLVWSINGVGPLAGSGGNVVLNSSNVPEGTNQYFTTTRFNTLGDARYATIASVAGKAETSAVIPYSAVAAYSDLAGIAAPAVGYLKFVKVATDAPYQETNSLYMIDEGGSRYKMQRIKENNQ